MKVRMCLWASDAFGIVQQWELCCLRWYRAGLDDDDVGNAFLAIGRAWGIYWVSIPLLRYSIHTHTYTYAKLVSVFDEKNSALDGWVVCDDVGRKLGARAYYKRAQPKCIHTGHLWYCVGTYTCVENSTLYNFLYVRFMYITITIFNYSILNSS